MAAVPLPIDAGSHARTIFASPPGARATSGRHVAARTVITLAVDDWLLGGC